MSEWPVVPKGLKIRVERYRNGYMVSLVKTFLGITVKEYNYYWDYGNIPKMANVLVTSYHESQAKAKVCGDYPPKKWGE